MSPLHFVGIAITVGLLLAIGILSGRKAKDARSFAVGGRASTWAVCGIIMGTLVGGQSTVGTAQMAFCYGLSAIWFTVGAALGSLFLALFFAIPLRRSGCITLSEIVAREYGHRAETIGSLLGIIGIFISIVSQVIASSALMTSLFSVSAAAAAVISALLIVFFVFFGGIRSAGLGGILKVVLLYVASLSAAVIVLRLSDGYDNLVASIDSLYSHPSLVAQTSLLSAADVHARYVCLLGRGPLKDIGSCLSLLLGVLSTQTYAQAIWAARSYKQARRGAILAALLTPLIGLACTLLGLYMRGHYITVAERDALLAVGETLPDTIGVLQNSAEVFPRFILDHCPAWLGGIALGTLFVTILGGGSGLTLGAATILVRDVFSNVPRPDGSHFGESRTLYRASITSLVAAALVVALLSHSTLINELGFLSLGLRAAALLVPLSCALFFPHRFSRQPIILAMIIGCATMIIAKIVNLPADPIFYGLGIEIVIVALSKRQQQK